MTPPFLTSPLLESVAGVSHGFFTRRGGVSTGLYDSLNVGRGSDQVATIDTDFGVASPRADGVATGTPGILCGALAADCAPVLLIDPRARVVCAAHAGWKGALGGVVESAVRAVEDLGGQANHMIAAVGPCIGSASYEVGPEFRDRFVLDAPANGRFFQAGAPGKFLFDLPGFVLNRLAIAGVGAAEWVGVDTAEDPDFFSNRRAFQRGEPDYGRLASVIVLTDETSRRNKRRH